MGRTVPTEAAAIVRQRLSDMAAHEKDAGVYAILRELIRACDPARQLIVMRDRRAA